MTTARQRMLYGRTSNNLPSRFLEEIPSETLDWQSRAEPRPQRSGWEEESSFADASFSGHTFGQQAQARSAASAPRRYRPTNTGRSMGFTAQAGSAAPLLQLQKGDRLRHRTFGEGMVLSIRPMGGDALIEVSFEKVGTKKLMLRAAGAHITKL